MTRINTNAPSPKFHEVESQPAEATHVKASAPPTAGRVNVVDEFVSGAPRRSPPEAMLAPNGRTFSVADLERMNPEQRAQAAGASVVQSAVYPQGEEEKYPLKFAEYREQLVATVMQNNDVSAKTMNGPDICAACSVVNALVLSGDAKASAAALRGVFEKNGAPLPPPMTSRDAQRALKSLASGQVSEFDVAVLQQVAAAVLEKMQRVADQQPGAEPGPGVSVPVLKAFVEGLVQKGAPLKGAKFELSTNSDGAHWTTTAHGVHADSAPSKTPRTTLGHFTA